MQNDLLYIKHIYYFEALCCSNSAFSDQRHSIQTHLVRCLIWMAMIAEAALL